MVLESMRRFFVLADQHDFGLFAGLRDAGHLPPRAVVLDVITLNAMVCGDIRRLGAFAAAVFGHR
jgi:hypothetical protein